MFARPSLRGVDDFNSHNRSCAKICHHYIVCRVNAAHSASCTVSAVGREADSLPWHHPSTTARACQASSSSPSTKHATTVVAPAMIPAHIENTL